MIKNCESDQYLEKLVNLVYTIMDFSQIIYENIHTQNDVIENVPKYSVE